MLLEIDKYFEQVDGFVYLGSKFPRDGKSDNDFKEGQIQETPLMEDWTRLALKNVKISEASSS